MYHTGDNEWNVIWANSYLDLSGHCTMVFTAGSPTDSISEDGQLEEKAVSMNHFKFSFIKFPLLKLNLWSLPASLLVIETQTNARRHVNCCP
jgi:hypothetical protein